MSPSRSRSTSPIACAAARRASLYPFTNRRPSQVQKAFTGIPRVLHRPIFPPRNNDAVNALSKGSRVPNSMKDVISLEESVRMAKGLAYARFKHDSDNRTVEVSASSDAPEDVILPSHLLRVKTPSTSRTSQTSSLHFPIHSVLFTAECSNIPILSPTSSSTSIPVIPLELPSPETFSIIHSHLYAHHIPGLMSDLLPINNKLLFAPGSPFDIPALARICATSMSAADLVLCGKRIYGVYLNARTLGVRDDDLWKAISIAWTIFTGALTIHVGRRHSLS